MDTSAEDTAMQARARSPAEIYDELFVPALFGQWGGVVAEAAGVARGQRVLDVACGTGAFATAAAARVGDEGRVTGIDPSADMLAVARSRHPGIEWQQGTAEALPFADSTFDAVGSQFGFMFFDDRSQALREMYRVLRPGGRMAVAVCGAVDHSPGYAVLTELLHRLFGHEIAESMRAPFCCGDRGLLAAAGEAAGLDGARISRHEGTVRFDSIQALVATERACVWTLGGLLDAAQFKQLADAAQESLAPFATAAGDIAFAMPAFLITATRD